MILFSKLFSLFLLFSVLLGIPKAVFAEEPLGVWSNTTSLPYLLASHGAFSHANRVSIVGGSAITGQSKFDVLTATPSADGSISSWAATSLTPTALIFHSLAKKDNYIYILGGREENPGSALAHVPKVFVGDVNNNGIVNSWTQLNSLPQGTSVGRTVVVGDRIYYAGGFNDVGVQDEVYYASINPDGTLGPWTTSSVSLPEPLFGFGMVEYQSNIIIVGGFNGSVFRNKTYRASVNPDGTISSWTETTALPEPVYRSGVIRIGSTLISVGSNQTTLGNKVFYANINSDGTLGVWQTSSNTLPQAVGAGAIAYANGYLYLTGGFGSSGYVDTVYYAPVNVSDEINLAVPLLKQNNPLWGSQVYDSANLWSPLSPNISSWGCAMTSAAMVFQYHGITKLPDDSNLNPGTLNAWLKSQPDGYIRSGLVNWLALSRLSRLSTPNNPGFAHDALEYRRINGEDKPQLTSDLQNDMPGILEEPGHFVVGRGTNLDTFNINDPLYTRATLNDGYSNTFLSLGRFIPSSTDLSYIMLVVDEEINISVKNSQGAVGESFLQQPLENDGAHGDFSGEPFNVFYLPAPSNGTYELELSSNSNNNYNLEVYYYDIDGNVHIKHFSGIVGPQDKDKYAFLFDKNNLDNSNSAHDVTFDSFIADIKSLRSLNEINLSNYLSLLAQAKTARSLAGSQITKIGALKLLKAMDKQILRAKRRGVSNNAYNILHTDIQAILANLSS